MESWDQIQDEPQGALLVVAGPHNGDASWATPHFPTLKPLYQHLVVCCPPSVIDIFHHNPYIDKIVITASKDLAHLATLAAESKKFGLVFPPVTIWPVEHKYNLLRTKQYLERRKFPVPSITPDLYISTTEIDSIVEFMGKHQGGPRLMVETFNYSRQTAFTLDWLSRVIDYVVSKHPQAWLFIPCSAKESINVPLHPRVVPLHQFTVRQCGFLANFCDYFLSCSSGVSHACSSTLTKPGLKWLETITNDWHSTKPYEIRGRKYHVGDDFDGYFRLLRELLP
jgi:hypothetical protein